MEFIADLHIHGRYSQGTSKNLDIASLEKYARMKGIGMLGTGDFTHPKWSDELKTELKDDGSGIFRTKDDFPFILQTEISLVYTKAGKGRRVHNIVFAPSMDAVQSITEALLKRGRVDYDGRPIFKIPCPEFVEILRDIDKDIEVVPAHIWTPWFSLFGAKSGFNRIEDAFEDQTKHIHALETGLSSDPPMNWRISSLDRFQLISNSDLHSYWPWRIGREANIFDTDLTYKSIIAAIRTGNGLKGTIEVDPNLGKYHFTGHRKCNVCLNPIQSKETNAICPVCKKLMTVGVTERIEELADRPEGYKKEDGKPFYSLIPLSELLSMYYKKPVASKTIWDKYNSLVTMNDSSSDKTHGQISEMDVLLNMASEDIARITDDDFTKIIMNNRLGKIKVKPGYDGVYGEPVLSDNDTDNDSDTVMNSIIKQKKMKDLTDFF
ncbi:endonuclease Q family protein [Candidatus Woesearchaeota archaeon]|nr:endonuclease Q family protein [Candidatus Woesearchaeota archaeon]